MTDDASRTLGPPLPSFLTLVGQGVQSLALGLVGHVDLNVSFATRAIGTLFAMLLLMIGSALVVFASSSSSTPSPPSPSSSSSSGTDDGIGMIRAVLLIPIIRFDLVLLLFSRLARVILWAGQLRARKILYSNEVFPLQVAALIWNDCIPMHASNRIEDEHALFVDVFHEQIQLWRPTYIDSRHARLLKFPIFLLLQLLCWLVKLIEVVLFTFWRILCDFGRRNKTPGPILGKRRVLPGHTALISDEQLSFIHEYGMRDLLPTETLSPPPKITMYQKREARRVLVRAVHLANLLEHTGFSRLNAHAPGRCTVGRYEIDTGDNPLIHDLMSRREELGVLQTYPGGMSATRGERITGPVMWARLVAGSLKGLEGEGRWRGPVCIAMLEVAQRNIDGFRQCVELNDIHRHVYSELRGWMVDWIMFMWWQLDLPVMIVRDEDELFGMLQTVLLDNLEHHAQSLPHAVGEMVISQPRTVHTDSMLILTLGDDWSRWAHSCYTASGRRLQSAMRNSGEYSCAGSQITPQTAINQSVYERRVLREVVEVDESASLAQQTRACFARRLVDVLTMRVKEAWLQQRYRLLDPPEMPDLDESDVDPDHYSSDSGSDDEEGGRQDEVEEGRGRRSPRKRKRKRKIRRERLFGLVRF